MIKRSLILLSSIILFAFLVALIIIAGRQFDKHRMRLCNDVEFAMRFWEYC